MNDILKWGTLIFTGAAGGLASFANVFPNHTAVLTGSAATASILAGLCLHPPWANPDNTQGTTINLTHTDTPAVNPTP